MTTATLEQPRFRKRLLSDDLVIAWRDQSQPEATNGGDLAFAGSTITYFSTVLGIRRVREDGTVWFLLNGDDHRSGGWGTTDHQATIRRALNNVPDRPGAHISFGLVRDGAPPEPDRKDYGYVEPEIEPLPAGEWPVFPYQPYYRNTGETDEQFAARKAEYEVRKAEYDRWNAISVRNGAKLDKAWNSWRGSGEYTRWVTDQGAWRIEWTHEGYTDTREPVVRLDFENYIIPFSTLRAARIEPRHVTPVHSLGERTIKVKRVNPDTKKMEEVDQHLLGSTLFATPVPVMETRTEKRTQKVLDHEEYWEGEGDPPGELQGYGDGQFQFGWSYRKKSSRWFYTVYRSEEYDHTWQEQVGTVTGYFLSGLDESGRNPNTSAFLVRLPGECETVGDAYEMLKPLQVRIAEDMGAEILRQGEWFFIRMSDQTQDRLNSIEKAAQKLRKQAQKEERDERHIGYLPIMPNEVELDSPRYGHCVFTKGKTLPDSSPRGSAHSAVWAITVTRPGGKVDTFVRGAVTHSQDEHRPLLLGEVWYSVHENTAIGSWAPAPGRGGGRGRVD